MPAPKPKAKPSAMIELIASSSSRLHPASRPMVKAALFGPVKLRPAGNAAPEREDLKRADEHDGNAEDGQDGSRDIAGLLHCEAANNCLG